MAKKNVDQPTRVFTPEGMPFFVLRTTTRRGRKWLLHVAANSPPSAAAIRDRFPDWHFVEHSKRHSKAMLDRKVQRTLSSIVRGAEKQSAAGL